MDTQPEGCVQKKTCRLCGSLLLLLSLRLQPTPPANEFVPKELLGKPQDLFPLDVMTCQDCGHVQLSHVVDPERLFRNYVYVSGTSPVFVNHFVNYAAQISQRFGLQKGDLVVEIGSNDGTLLLEFKKLGMKVLGVDPAKAIAEKATRDGVTTLPEFFTPELAIKIAKDYGRASLVVANNVFAHADDLGSIVAGINVLLKPNGVFIFENSYLIDMVEKNLWDMVYSEHTSYHSVGPLFPFFRKYGMNLFDVEKVSTHGGSIRCFVGVGRNIELNVDKFRDKEHNLGYIVPGWAKLEKPDPVHELGIRVAGLREELTQTLTNLKKEGKKIWGYGAPAKATTLMYEFGLGKDFIEAIVDDSPLKQGLYTPGKHIPVAPSSFIEKEKPDYLLILAWNFAESIMKKCQNFKDQGGKFITPVPKIEII